MKNFAEILEAPAGTERAPERCRAAARVAQNANDALAVHYAMVARLVRLDNDATAKQSDGFAELDLSVCPGTS